MIKFRVYPSWLVHLGKLDPEKSEPFYVSLCGRKLIGYPIADDDVYELCKRCQKSFDHASAVYAELERRFV